MFRGYDENMLDSILRLLLVENIEYRWPQRIDTCLGKLRIIPECCFGVIVPHLIHFILVGFNSHELEGMLEPRIISSSDTLGFTRAV